MGLGSQGTRSSSRSFFCSALNRPLFSHLQLLLCLALCFCCFGPRTAQGYKNYTVGGDLGWFDKLEKPTVDYTKWAAASNFSLGDFLIFHTDRNHSVVQTYNLTTYKSCSSEDSLDSDTRLWSNGGAPTVDSTPVTVEVPLVKEGANYFFSGDYDGEQCRNGQRFQITVAHGQGLPASLSTPEPSAPGPAAEDDGSAPDMDVPENFDHPKEVQAEKGSDTGGAVAVGLGQSRVLVVGLAVLQCIVVGLFG